MAHKADRDPLIGDDDPSFSKYGGGNDYYGNDPGSLGSGELLGYVRLMYAKASYAKSTESCCCKSWSPLRV